MTLLGLETLLNQAMKDIKQLQERVLDLSKRLSELETNRDQE